MTLQSTAQCRPLFVVGSARSGTTLLYHTLLSTGEYAVYRGEPAVFDLLQPRYGDLRERASRTRLLREWPRSHLAHASGLDDRNACEELLVSIDSNGEFLRAVMDRIAARQHAARWAVWGPDNLLLMRWIKRELPDARFVHMVRDGRDVALSIGTEGWIRPFPWHAGSEALAAALHWQWKVRRGRQESATLGGDYIELAFEELVANRAAALARLSAFLGHSIDEGAVLASAVGTLREPNSTFVRDGSAPVGRWRRRMPAATLARIEAEIGSTLEEFGYARSTDAGDARTGISSALYPMWFSLKHALRTYTLLGRRVDPRRLRLDESAAPPSIEHDVVARG